MSLVRQNFLTSIGTKYSFHANLRCNVYSWCMYVLVRLSQHVMSAQDTGSFLSMTFASALIQVKRAFDKFMQTQLQSILCDVKVNRRNKCGILPYVENFEPFARTAEKIFKNSDRKVDLEKWYTKLVSTMFEAIVTHSREHHKTPQEVIKMGKFKSVVDLLPVSLYLVILNIY